MKALFVGLGSVGQRHLRNLQELLGDDLQAIAWRAARTAPLLDGRGGVDAGVELSAHYPIREFDTLEAALSERPDVAFICNPNSLHVGPARAVVAAGCDVFMEKPVSHSADGVSELIAEAAEREKIVAVGFQYRFHPGLVLAKQWFEEGRIGQLVSASLVNGEYMPGWHPYENYRTSYGARSDLGGGALVSQIHEFDTAFWFFGEPERVFAVGGQLSRLELDVEDSATVLLKMVVDGRSVPVDIHLDYLQSPPARSFTIVGDEGRIVWHDQMKSVTLERINEGLVESRSFEDFDRNEMFMDELRDFITSVRERRSPKVDIRAGAVSLRVALAARTSMETGNACVLAERNE
jgi:predicted dehydrogenase